MKRYTNEDYYREIDQAIKSYEEHRQFHPRTLSWLSDRIDWCWKWRKITEEQCDELCNRMVEIFESQTNYLS